jgi:hypothetical protein
LSAYTGCWIYLPQHKSFLPSCNHLNQSELAKPPGRRKCTRPFSFGKLYRCSIFPQVFCDYGSTSRIHIYSLALQIV